MYIGIDIVQILIMSTKPSVWPQVSPHGEVACLGDITSPLNHGVYGESYGESYTGWLPGRW